MMSSEEESAHVTTDAATDAASGSIQYEDQDENQYENQYEDLGEDQYENQYEDLGEDQDEDQDENQYEDLGEDQDEDQDENQDEDQDENQNKTVNESTRGADTVMEVAGDSGAVPKEVGFEPGGNEPKLTPEDGGRGGAVDGQINRAHSPIDVSDGVIDRTGNVSSHMKYTGSEAQINDSDAANDVIEETDTTVCTSGLHNSHTQITTSHSALNANEEIASKSGIGSSKTVVSDGFQSVLCGVSSIDSNSRRKSLQHMTRQILNVPSYHCRNCKVRITKKQKILRHVEFHGDRAKGYLYKSSYVCAMCERNFEKKFTCEQHVKNHHRLVHDCTHCGWVFETAFRVQVHSALWHTNGSKVKMEVESAVLLKESIPHTMKAEKIDIEIYDLNGSENFEAIKEESSLTDDHSSVRTNDLDDESSTTLLELEEKSGAEAENSAPPVQGNVTLAGNAQATPVKIQCPCPVCNRPMFTSTKLKEHIENHGKMVFVCQVEGCGFAFDKESSLKQHDYRRHGNTGHGKAPKYPCPTCKRIFWTRVQMQDHLANHDKMAFACASCGAAFDKAMKLKLHVASKHTTAQKQSQSGPCSQNLKGVTAIKSNSFGSLNTCHPHVMKYVCRQDDCRCAYEEFHNLQTHYKKHHNIELGSEERANHQVPRSKTVEIHQSKTCQLCGRNFITPQAMNEHIKRHKNMTYSCREENCYCAYEEFANLQSHYRDRHQMRIRLDDSVNYVIRRPNTGNVAVASFQSKTCDLCGRYFHSLKALGEHIESHDKMGYVCKEGNCRCAYEIFNNLQAHCRDRHKMKIVIEDRERYKICVLESDIGGDVENNQTPVEKRDSSTENLPLPGRKDFSAVEDANHAGHTCHLCGRHFNNLPVLNFHLGRHDHMMYECRHADCRCAFEEFYNLKTHCTENHNLQITDADMESYLIEKTKPQNSETVTTTASQADTPVQPSETTTSSQNKIPPKTAIPAVDPGTGTSVPVNTVHSETTNTTTTTTTPSATDLILQLLKNPAQLQLVSASPSVTGSIQLLNSPMQPQVIAANTPITAGVPVQLLNQPMTQVKLVNTPNLNPATAVQWSSTPLPFVVTTTHAPLSTGMPIQLFNQAVQLPRTAGNLPISGGNIQLLNNPVQSQIISVGTPIAARTPTQLLNNSLQQGVSPVNTPIAPGASSQSSDKPAQPQMKAISSSNSENFAFTCTGRKCSICRRYFINDEELSYHVTNHYLMTHACHYINCGFMYEQLSQLQLHYQMRHKLNSTSAAKVNRNLTSAVKNDGTPRSSVKRGRPSKAGARNTPRDSQRLGSSTQDGNTPRSSRIRVRDSSSGAVEDGGVPESSALGAATTESVFQDEGTPKSSAKDGATGWKETSTSKSRNKDVTGSGDSAEDGTSARSTPQRTVQESTICKDFANLNRNFTNDKTISKSAILEDCSTPEPETAAKDVETPKSDTTKQSATPKVSKDGRSTGWEKRTCSICFRRFATMQAMQYHVTHHDLMTFMCQEDACICMFEDFANLQKHYTGAHKLAICANDAEFYRVITEPDLTEPDPETEENNANNDDGGDSVVDIVGEGVGDQETVCSEALNQELKESTGLAEASDGSGECGKQVKSRNAEVGANRDSKDSPSDKGDREVKAPTSDSSCSDSGTDIVLSGIHHSILKEPDVGIDQKVQESSNSGFKVKAVDSPTQESNRSSPIEGNSLVPEPQQVDANDRTNSAKVGLQKCPVDEEIKSLLSNESTTKDLETVENVSEKSVSASNELQQPSSVDEVYCSKKQQETTIQDNVGTKTENQSTDIHVENTQSEATIGERSDPKEKAPFEERAGGNSEPETPRRKKRNIDTSPSAKEEIKEPSPNRTLNMMISSVNNKSPKSSKIKTNHTCKTCGRTMNGPVNLEKHVKNHDKMKYKCQEGCGYMYLKFELLRNHYMDRHHKKISVKKERLYLIKKQSPDFTSFVKGVQRTSEQKDNTKNVTTQSAKAAVMKNETVPSETTQGETVAECTKSKRVQIDEVGRGDQDSAVQTVDWKVEDRTQESAEAENEAAESTSILTDSQKTDSSEKIHSQIIEDMDLGDIEESENLDNISSKADITSKVENNGPNREQLAGKVPENVCEGSTIKTITGNSSKYEQPAETAKIDSTEKLPEAKESRDDTQVSPGRRSSRSERTCEICNRYFHTVHGLKVHLGSHDNMKYKCRHDCGYMYQKFEKLQIHCREKHNLLLRLSEKQTYSVSAEQLQKPASCPICRRSFKAEKSCAQHVKDHSKMMYQCEHCKWLYEEFNCLSKHYEHMYGENISTNNEAKYRINESERRSAAHSEGASVFIGEVASPNANCEGVAVTTDMVSEEAPSYDLNLMTSDVNQPKSEDAQSAASAGKAADISNAVVKSAEKSDLRLDSAKLEHPMSALTAVPNLTTKSEGELVAAASVTDVDASTSEQESTSVADEAKGEDATTTSEEQAKRLDLPNALADAMSVESGTKKALRVDNAENLISTVTGSPVTTAAGNLGGWKQCLKCERKLRGTKYREHMRNHDNLDFRCPECPGMFENCSVLYMHCLKVHKTKLKRSEENKFRIRVGDHGNSLEGYEMDDIVCKDEQVQGHDSSQGELFEAGGKKIQNLGADSAVSGEGFDCDMSVENTDYQDDKLNSAVDFFLGQLNKSEGQTSAVDTGVSAENRTESDVPAPKEESPQNDSRLCLKCQRRFKSNVNLTWHMENHDQMVYRCFDCGAMYEKFVVLQRHCFHTHQVKVTLGDRKMYHINPDQVQDLSCALCQRRFKTAEKCTEHLKNHSELPYKCDQCDFLYEDFEGLRIHCSRTHKNNIYIADKEKFDVQRKIKSTGKKKIPKNEGTSENEKNAEIMEIAEKDTNAEKERPVKSKLGKSKGRKSSVTLPEGKLQCEICNRKFRVKNELTKHVEKHSAMRYKCDQCGYMYKLFPGLSAHYLEQHSTTIVKEDATCKLSCAEESKGHMKEIKELVENDEKSGCTEPDQNNDVEGKKGQHKAKDDKGSGEKIESVVASDNHDNKLSDDENEAAESVTKVIGEVRFTEVEQYTTEKNPDANQVSSAERESPERRPAEADEALGEDEGVQNSSKPDQVTRYRCFRCKALYKKFEALKKHCSNKHETLIDDETASMCTVQVPATLDKKTKNKADKVSEKSEPKIASEESKIEDSVDPLKQPEGKASGATLKSVQKSTPKNSGRKRPRSKASETEPSVKKPKLSKLSGGVPKLEYSEPALKSVNNSVPKSAAESPQSSGLKLTITLTGKTPRAKLTLKGTKRNSLKAKSNDAPNKNGLQPVVSKSMQKVTSKSLGGSPKAKAVSKRKSTTKKSIDAHSQEEFQPVLLKTEVRVKTVQKSDNEKATDGSPIETEKTSANESPVAKEVTATRAPAEKKRKRLSEAEVLAKMKRRKRMTSDENGKSLGGSSSGSA